ncbi:hypothetical protein Csa_022743 [Cucumis sativus]|uniref:Uncharacterized protein n=1 Tax=Cucumis sativus TaxID=3659 RepID=A0A0A0LSS7_CUCSA|nr:hypothetical protein Csa_022743 [Cucumis sativus]
MHCCNSTCRLPSPVIVTYQITVDTGLHGTRCSLNVRVLSVKPTFLHSPFVEAPPKANLPSSMLPLAIHLYPELRHCSPTAEPNSLTQVVSFSPKLCASFYFLSSVQAISKLILLPFSQEQVVTSS